MEGRKPMIGLPVNLFENRPSEKTYVENRLSEKHKKRLSENHGGQKADDWRARKSL